MKHSFNGTSILGHFDFFESDEFIETEGGDDARFYALLQDFDAHLFNRSIWGFGSDFLENKELFDLFGNVFVLTDHFKVCWDIS